MNRTIHIIIYIMLATLPLGAQRAQMGKLSPWLRQVARSAERQQTAEHGAAARSLTAAPQPASLIAFIRLTPGGGEALPAHGCQSLAHFGDLHIARIPLTRLAPLSADRRVQRIEASRSNQLLTDSMAHHLNATAAYSGQGLPQAYTGRGIIMGIMDVGFDLTHPTFYSRDTTDYRIRAFWDQLSQDTVGSTLPVGRDYAGRQQLLALAHSRDGAALSHGTHTLGIAAGSGYQSPYRGIAPEADICLVANAVSDDLPFIDSADVYKYTYATDALGFKYIFDYADRMQQPCVISFSEGSAQDFYGYDQLYYAFLDSLCGPGRIIVAAAGNDGYRPNYVHKASGRRSAGTFLRSDSPSMDIVIKSADDFALRLVSYGSTRDTLLLQPRQALLMADSVLSDSTAAIAADVYAYPSSYAPDDELCYDLVVRRTDGGSVGSSPHLSIELLGEQADIEMWRISGNFLTRSDNAALTDALPTHYVHSPSSAPSVISVGATTYRDFIVNFAADTMTYWRGADGLLAEFSSRGPTFDGRTKPDCVAPGNNIISSYSSYYLEEHPDARDVLWDVERFPFQGRTYSWNSNTGTSMSAPAVGGTIALWLQACPTLSPADVLAVIARTSRHPQAGIDYPNNEYGYGQIDAYAGLLDILGFSSLPDIPKRHTSARLSTANGRLAIDRTEPAAEALPLRLYTLQGQPVMSATLPAGQQRLTVTLPPLPSGIYAVVIGRESTLIRIN